MCEDAKEYQVSQEVPLLGSHVVEPHASVHEAADGVARRQREGAVLRQGRGRDRLTGGTGVLTLTGGAGALSCREKRAVTNSPVESVSWIQGFNNRT